MDLTLKEFGLPRTDQWDGDKKDYVIEMLDSADDATLIELAKHLDLASQLEITDEPEFWSHDQPRIFLSHLARNKTEIAQLKTELEAYGLITFVAHEDIEPTKEWQTEIESALETMDALVALLAPGFKESDWCDQEIGFAIGRKLPIIAIKFGLDPYGFIGKYQAVQGARKTLKKLAKEVFDLFMLNTIVGSKITDTLVRQLSDSYSFDRSKKLIDYIKESSLKEPSFLDSKHITVMEEAVKNNSQVRDAWGVPEEIKQLAKKIKN